MKRVFFKIAMIVAVLGVLAGALALGITHSTSTHAATFSEPCPPTQSQGHTSTWVTVIQFELNAFHTGNPISFAHFPLATDGIFGPDTKSAVTAFQRFEHIPVTGVVNAQTWAWMSFCNTSGLFNAGGHTGLGFISGEHCPPKVGVGSSGVWVQALQQSLNVTAGDGVIAKTYNKQTWWPLARDGIYGAHTVLAVKSFQAHNHIAQDGTAGNLTWGAMGLCY